jgi:hypothetical protein
MTAEIPILAAIAILFAAALVRGAFGFGDALIAMPLLALIVPMTVATPVVAFLGPTIALILLVRDWRHVELKSTMRLILSTLAGIPLGLFYLKRINEHAMNLVLALVIILFSLYNLVRPGLLKLRTDKSAILFGFIAGILGAAYNTNGPPVVLYGALRGWKPESFRATLQGYFLPTGGAILIGQGLAGLWTRPVITTTIYALPFILIAVILGAAIGRRIPASKFSRYVYGLLLVLGAVLLIRSI